MHVNVDKKNIEIDITHDHKELNEWVEQIGKTANEICNNPYGNRIKLNEQHTGISWNQMMLGHWAVLVGLLSVT
jgi:hypothetical protein